MRRMFNTVKQEIFEFLESVVEKVHPIGSSLNIGNVLPSSSVQLRTLPVFVPVDPTPATQATTTAATTTWSPEFQQDSDSDGDCTGS